MPSVSQSVPALIRSRLSDFSGVSRRLASYVAEHPDAVAFMAARALAEATGSSDAAVVRFAQGLGYAGFLEMRAALRQELLNKTGATAFAAGALRADSDTDLVADVFALDVRLVQQTAQINERAAYDRIAERLICCRRVRVVAHGTSAPLAFYLAVGLNRALHDVRVVTIGQADLAEDMRDFGPKDGMIGIGYVRYLPHTLELMELARRRKAAVFAITDNLNSPLASLADETLLAGRDGTSFNVSQIGTVSIAHAIIAAVARLTSGTLSEQLRAADEVWEELGLWSAMGEGQRRNPRSDRERQSQQQKDG